MDIPLITYCYQIIGGHQAASWTHQSAQKSIVRKVFGLIIAWMFLFGNPGFCQSAADAPSDDELKPGFEEMPQRFMVGTDEKFGRLGKGVLAGRGQKVAKYEKKIKHMRKILGSLNPAAAEMIAYKNAEKIY